MFFVHGDPECYATYSDQLPAPTALLLLIEGCLIHRNHWRWLLVCLQWPVLRMYSSVHNNYYK